MAYTPTVWNTGDTITAEKLNKLEGGVAALSNYDLEIQHFYENGVPKLTAQGLSPSELYAKAPNAKAVYSSVNELEEEYTVLDSIKTLKNTYNESIQFAFRNENANRILTIALDGTAYFEQSGTYTYSDGVYTFENVFVK